MDDTQLRELIDNFNFWNDELMQWLYDHKPSEADLKFAREALANRPDVLAEIERLNSTEK